MIISMVIWGISWPINHFLTAFGSPIHLGIFRYSIVIVSLLIVILAARIPLIIAKKGLLFLVISGLLMAIYNYTFLQGLTLGNPGAGGILVTTLNPILAYGLGILIEWKKPTKNESIGLFLGILAGLTLLKIWDNLSILTSGGNLYFLASALIWSVMSKFTSKSANFGSPIAFSWWMYVVTLLLLLPFSHFSTLQTMVHDSNWIFWGSMLFGSIVTTTFATTLYFFATSKLGAEKASSFIFTVPFSAAISAFLILGERIEWHTLLGGLLGIGAVWMINRKTK